MYALTLHRLRDSANPGNYLGGNAVAPGDSGLAETLAAAPPRGRNLIRNLGLDELRQKSERLLPAETASLGWDNSRQALLHDIQLGPQETLFKVIVVCIGPGRFGSSNLSV
jgi:hypothetical protein